MKFKGTNGKGTWWYLFPLLLAIFGFHAEALAYRAKVFTIPTQNSLPSGLVAPSGRAVWFIESNTKNLTCFDHDKGIGQDMVIVGRSATVTMVTEQVEEEAVFNVQPTSSSVTPSRSSLRPSSISGFVRYSHQLSLALDLAFYEHGLWLTSRDSNVIAHFDPTSGNLTTWGIPTANFGVTDITFHNGFAWAIGDRSQKLLRLDPSNNAIDEWNLPLAQAPLSLMVDHRGRIWIADARGALYRFQPDTNTLSRMRISAGSPLGGPRDLLWDGQRIWMSIAYDSNNRPCLYSFDPEGVVIQRWLLPTEFGRPDKLELDPFGRIWVLTCDPLKIGCFDPSTNTFTTYTFESSFSDLSEFAIDPEGNVWFVNDGRNAIGFVEHAAFYTVYVPHFDCRGGWWTGVALKNPNRGNVRVKLYAFSNDGELRSIEEVTLSGYERKTWLIGQSIFRNLETGWIKAVATEPIEGFVLFGQGTMLAGVEALTHSGKEVSFSHFHQDAEWWTGIAVLNTSLMWSNLSLYAYETSGDQSGTIERQIPPLGKLVDTIQNLFGFQNHQGSLEASVPFFNSITGFVLFGTQDFSSLAGINASTY